MDVIKASSCWLFILYGFQMMALDHVFLSLLLVFFFFQAIMCFALFHSIRHFYLSAFLFPFVTLLFFGSCSNSPTLFFF